MFEPVGHTTRESLSAELLRPTTVVLRADGDFDWTTLAAGRRIYLRRYRLKTTKAKSGGQNKEGTGRRIRKEAQLPPPKQTQHHERPQSDDEVNPASRSPTPSHGRRTR